MSGVAGIYAYHYAANPVDRAELGRIRDYLASRGPDGAGEWYSQDSRVGLGHRPLNVHARCQAGTEWMESADRSLVITFDGRIYNYRELRLSLEGRGHVFRTQTEAELLLHMYAEKGEHMVHDLRGMFAFALWDDERRALFLARDPFGMKPLYYADDGWTFRFASQVKALLAGGSISRSPEPAGWVGFCLFGSVPEPYTTYQEIRALPAGSTLWVDRLGGWAPKQYFSIAAQYCEAECARASVAKEDLLLNTHEALRDSVRRHVDLTSDDPIGVLLSGESNSGALLGLVRDVAQPKIQAVTITFGDAASEGQDASVAKEIAALYGAPHVTRVVTEDEFRDELPKILDAMDQPTIGGFIAWFLSKAARELGVKVAISAVGGDQLFGDYQPSSEVQRCVRALATPARIPGLRKLARWFLPRQLLDLAALLEFGGGLPGAYLARRGLFMPWELENVLGSETSRRGLRRLNPIRHIKACLAPHPRTAFDKRAVLEWSLYTRNQVLRDMDWASMAHSIELRAPLLDVRLLRHAAIAVQDKKLQSRTVLASSPRVPLPARIVRHRKAKSGQPINWLQEDARFQRWRTIHSDSCPGMRRWALQMVPT